MTFAAEDNLQQLPLVPLEELYDKYIRTVSPLVSDTEKEEAQKEITKYLEGSGRDDYERLKKFHATVDNYLHQFWEDAYLEDDSSLVLNVNPIFIFEDDPTPARNNQVERAASLLFSAFKFISAVKTETLTPDIWRNTPLCMSQFKKLFGSARIPKFGKDEVVTYSDSKHIVIINNGRFYMFDALNNMNKVYLTQREIRLNLEKILADESSCSFNIGLLTGLKRDKWASIRELLKRTNKNSLELVDSALMIVCLDDFETDRLNVNEQVSSALCGKIDEQHISSSRWYDKIQLIVSKNGQASVNFEHSVVDGHTVLRFVSDVFTDTIIRFAKTISGTRVENFLRSESIDSKHSPFRRRIARQVKRLHFNIEPNIKQELKYATEFLEDVASTLKVATLEYSSYGKSFITSFKMSPDAFVQMSILATCFTLYGRLENTYESVLTKTFKQGRTEVGRSVSEEALLFVKQLCLVSQKEKENTLVSRDKEELVLLLKKAIQQHGKTIKAASKGQGIDRILFAMKKIQPKERNSSFFSSFGYKILCKNFISTSNCGNPSLRFFGFGPVVKDGFGIGYVIKDESLNYCITSYEKRPGRFVTLLREYLNKIHDLIISLEANGVEDDTDEIANEGVEYLD